jgi:trehalose/maltose hydrolase-like predicted phosphorylase
MMRSGLLVFKKFAWLVLCLGQIALTQSTASEDAAQNQEQGQPLGSFVLTSENYRQYAQVLMGNGFLIGATPWNGAAPTSSTLVGLYDHLEQRAYSYQPLIPSWNEVDYWNGSHWLNQVRQDEFNADAYQQKLDTHHGILQTQYDWTDGKQVTHVSVESFVAQQEPGLGVVRFSFTPIYGVEAGPVTVSFPLGGGEAEPFVWEGMTLPGALPLRKVGVDPDHRGFWVVCRTRDGANIVAETVRLRLPAALVVSEVSLGLVSDLRRPSLNVKFIVNIGETYVFVKYVAVATGSSEQPVLHEAQRTVRLAAEQGYEKLLQEHQHTWENLWRSDIVIEGDPEAQRAAHAALYYLISMLRPGSAWSLPAIGPPSKAYLGRVWWDADTWMFPSLLLMHPELAESMVSYRERLLPGAIQNAKNHGYSGAQFPMESAATGLEEAPEWSSEIHAGGDVALAQWRYFQATGDLLWLREHGYPVIHDIADFWLSRVRRDPSKDRYEILHLTGPNEAVINVDNNAYTNAIARLTLQIATRAARLLGNAPNPKWEQIAAKLFIPVDDSGQFHLEHEGDIEGRYAHTTVMLAYPLGLAMPDEVKRNDLEACLKNFKMPGYEVGMLGNFYSIVSSELRRTDLASELFEHMVHAYAKPPYYAMSETPGNNRFVFLTAEGAFLQQILFGFTGLRLTDKGLTQEFKPELPTNWSSLEIRNIKVRGKTLNIRVNKDAMLSMTRAE